MTGDLLDHLAKAFALPTFDTNINISVSQRLASGYRSDEGGGNAIMLTSGRRDESGQRKAQQELE
jgi:hypothetical protein